MDIKLTGKPEYTVDVGWLQLIVLLACLTIAYVAYVTAEATRYASDAVIRNNAWVEKAIIRQNERRMAGIPLGPRIVEEK